MERANTVFSWLLEAPRPVWDERLPLCERRDRHRLVVQFACGSWCKGGNLTIRVKPREHSSVTQNGTYPFHFFIDALLEYQFSPHAADEHS